MRVTTFPVVAAMSTLIEHAPLPAVLESVDPYGSKNTAREQRGIGYRAD